MGFKKINRVTFIKKIAQDMDLPYSTVRAVIDEVFKMSEEYLSEPHMHNKPALFLRAFGTFEPVLRRLAAKAYKAEEQKDKWINYKDLVGDYYNSKNYKNKNGKRTEQQKKEDNSSG
jgi:nucleoid DNA-binding protein